MKKKKLSPYLTALFTYSNDIDYFDFLHNILKDRSNVDITYLKYTPIKESTKSPKICLLEYNTSSNNLHEHLSSESIMHPIYRQK